jgi:hypothetical protein|tara:strand:- start:1253 stop:1435 length:183 start_codon:yes stop_codon:yes gene_type:complete
MTKKYKTIKWVLKKQIDSLSKTLWTWRKGKDENFTCIYKDFKDELPIYTPQQLLNLLNEK